MVLPPRTHVNRDARLWFDATPELRGRGTNHGVCSFVSDQRPQRQAETSVFLGLEFHGDCRAFCFFASFFFCSFRAVVAEWFGFGEFYAMTCTQINLEKRWYSEGTTCTLPEVPSVLVVQLVWWQLHLKPPKRMLRPRYSAPGLGVHCRDSSQFETRLHHSPCFL